MEPPTKKAMVKHYFSDPRKKAFMKKIRQASVKYYYFKGPINLATSENEVCNFCLLKGIAKLRNGDKEFTLNQFDIVFLPENERVTIIPAIEKKLENKICIMTSPILGDIGRQLNAKFEIAKFSLDKFIPRGEFGDTQKMATYREVWTAFKNGYFMSGFTNIPEVALAQGVVTSVNVEKDGNSTRILPHIHPNYPEIYIFCIDISDPIAVTQFLINTKGQSVSRDLTDGEGIFFDGSLGHLNFAKPTLKKLKYCLYLWIIATFGKTQEVTPITLWI